MSKASRQNSKNEQNKKFNKKAQINNDINFGSAENQNENHNAKVEALGPNTKR